MNRSTQPFLKAVNLSKRYGGVEALRQVDLDIFPGEVIGVVGDTDSGKSTLLRLIAGGIPPDNGQFYIKGQRARLAPSHRAARYGIKAVHQEINHAEHMSALAYIFAGKPPRQRAPLHWLGWWRQDVMCDLARAEFARLGFEAPPLGCPLHDLTSAQRKMVAYVQATIRSPRLLVLDEPMYALEMHKARILDLIEDLCARGGSVLLVTQNLDDVFRIADRIMVLNAGFKIAERHTDQTTEEEIVRLILGSVEDRMTPAVWALSNYFEVRRQADELDRLNKALERRAVQLQAHADVARSATSILDRDELLEKTVQIIQQRFDYYCASIFLVDASGKYIELRSSASRDTPPLESGNIRLQIGDEGMISWCATIGQPRLANDVTQDILFNPEHALPDAQSELVLPLRIGNRVLGVLDLQSDRVDAFDKDDVQVLQGLADQLAIAIRNADLFETAEQARRQADEANRYKSVFLSNMSHELRTPLSAIIGHTQAMLHPNSEFYSEPIPEEYRHDLGTIRKSGEHLLALINDILDLNKIEVGEMKLNQTVIDLVSILDNALYTASGLIHGRDVRLRQDYPDTLPLVWADKVRTQQIMFNLISNAAKFTEAGSITVSTVVQDDEVTISVADTGIGIPERMQKLIFDRFRQGDLPTSKKYGGTGLGLSISQQLVELQGGRIWVKSEVNSGSVFSFTIPLATPEQLAAHGGKPVDAPLLDARRSVVFEPQDGDWQKSDIQLVLLAYHDLTDSYDLRQALEDQGYVVELAPVDQTVIDIAEIMLPDLVILDATAAGKTGILHTLAERAGICDFSLIVLATGEMPPAIKAAIPPEAAIRWLDQAATTSQQVIQVACACLQNMGSLKQQSPYITAKDKPDS
jgi:signal transduction histidine kinase/CheY-like chemotaxis protein